jgi:hypothetical protein
MAMGYPPATAVRGAAAETTKKVTAATPRASRRSRTEDDADDEAVD